NPLMRATPTPSPIWMQRTPRPPSAPSLPPVRLSRLDREVTLARGTLAGLCMTMFAGDIIGALALYRFVPRLRPDAGSSAAIVASETVAKPVAAPAIEVAPLEPPPAAKVANVEPEPPAPAPVSVEAPLPAPK